MTFAHLYSVKREFNVSIDKLWHAWTDAPALSAWHHPVGMSCVPGATQSEMKIGGLWTYAVQLPGRESISYFYGKYSLIQENLRFEHSMHYQNLRMHLNLKISTPQHIKYPLNLKLGERIHGLNLANMVKRQKRK